jgi:hypothetical protein
MNTGYELYGEVFQAELEARFASPEFTHRVTLLGRVRDRLIGRRA